jgi:magnesium chelatase subunit I
VYAALPAITGKFELEYEGELKGADNVARELIRSAAGDVFNGWLPNADLRQVTDWFDLGGSLAVDDTLSARELLSRTEQVQGLQDLARQIAGKRPSEAVLASAVDFVLEGLYAQRKISRTDEGQFSAAEPMKRTGPRIAEPLGDRDFPVQGGKKKYYN